MRLRSLAASGALLAACFSKPPNTTGGNGDGGVDAPIDGPSIGPDSPALLATGGGGGGTGGHACRIVGGVMLCWGANNHGQLGQRFDVVDFNGNPGRVSADVGWTSVATGVQHTCGVRAGAVYCWGENNFGQSVPGLSPTANIDITQVTLPGTAAADRVFAGGFATCATTTAGDAFCWGDLEFLLAPGPSVVMRLGAAGTRFTQVALAVDHVCAIADDGVVHCWGKAGQRQTGRGDNVDLAFAQAAPIASTARFSSLSSGREATCGTTTTGALVCWGSSNQGQLAGTSGPTAGNAPLEIHPGPGWTSVAVGARHTCGVRDGDVYCFGDDQYGALGAGTFSGRRQLSAMVATGMKVSQVAASDGFSCALSADGGQLKCWGTNAKGELGNKEFSRKLDPTPVTLIADAQQIVTGNNHTCALVGDQLPAPAYCWGLNSERQIGSASSQVLHAEPAVVVGNTFHQLAAGGLHTCGITSNQAFIACWGNNVSYQLGYTNGATITTVSVPAAGGVRWTSVAAGSQMSCGITDTNRLFCWGLRPGISLATATPMEYVPPVDTWKSISIGSDFAVAVLSASSAPRVYGIADPMKLCAANLPSNQVSPQTPTQILSGIFPANTNFPTVAAAQHSGAHTCLLRTDSSTMLSSVTCFGTSSSGQTGGATACSTMPNFVDVVPPAGSMWLGPVAMRQTLFTANDHSCALDSNRQLVCWGQNSNFELGREFPGGTPTVISAKPWVSIAGAFDHTCGIDTAYDVFCWGENQYGQNGDGSSYEPSPVVSGVP